LSGTADHDLCTRLIVRGAAASDVLVRTALSSAVTAAALPWALSPAARTEHKRLAFYEGLPRDAAQVFEPPPARVEVRSARGTPWSFRAPGGAVQALQFTSPFVALNPHMRTSYGRFARNQNAVAQYWRHDDGPRPTLCVIHGFGASPYFVNSAFFALPWLYSRGYDVLLYVLPFHGPRRAHLADANGFGLFAHGPSHFNEAMLQAVYDFRVFVNHLRACGVEQIGVTGLSLGGYVSALLAAIEDRLACAVPNAAVVSIPKLIGEWFPLDLALALATALRGTGRAELERTFALHCPLSYAPILPPERLMIIGGLGDRLAPPEQSELLWEHWGRPQLHWYPGNHILHVNRAAYLRAMRRFMSGVGFGWQSDA
jgi:pimeloyl-ACP methyl ester carboxylesterase